MVVFFFFFFCIGLKQSNASLSFIETQSGEVMFIEILRLFLDCCEQSNEDSLVVLNSDEETMLSLKRIESKYEVRYSSSSTFQPCCNMFYMYF